ncbi:MAG: hypothetical protein U0Q22_12030 [Acidimicrobiales bacterium]
MSFVNRSRRLGERHAVLGVVVDWNTGGRRRPGFGRRAFEEADVIDVSVTGAQLLAPRDERIRVNQHLTIVAAGALGTVRVRRVADLVNGRLSVYGVEFSGLEPALEALMFSQIAGR